jgi:hypothetical protein
MTTTQTTNMAIGRERYTDSNQQYPVKLSCYIKSQQAFYSGSSTPLPFTLDDMQTVVQADTVDFPPAAYHSMSFYSTTPSDATYYRYYEIGLENWMMQDTSSVDFIDYLGGTADADLERSGSTLVDAGT